MTSTTINWTKDIQDFIDMKIYLSNGDEHHNPGHPVRKWEEFLQQKFNISWNVVATEFTKRPIHTISSTKIESYYDYKILGGKYFMYGCDTIIVLFPDSGLRMKTGLNFIKTIPYLYQIYQNNFTERFIRLPYYDYTMSYKYQGPLLFVSNADLDSLVYSPLIRESKLSGSSVAWDDEESQRYDQDNLGDSLKSSMKYI
jgi:hypothetical protein